MKEQVLQYIRAHHMLEKGDHVITGVSGGADSVCLLFTLVLLREELQLQLTAVHVNHRLRGLEAEQDAAFVEELCRRWDVDYRMYQYDVADIAGRRGISLEEAGRQVRYECFEEVCRSDGGSKIAVAHNKDDQAETILMNLLRGSGLKGLGGIPAVRQQIIRPLLATERSEIEQFLEENGIRYCTDRTNFEDCYTRNKIRLHVLPYLKKEINNQVVSHISASGEIFQDADAYIWKEAAAAMVVCTRETRHGCLLLEEPVLQQEDIIQNRIVLEVLRMVAGTQRDIAAVHIRAVRELFLKQSGRKINLPYGITAERGYEGVEIQRSVSAVPVPEPITVPVSGTLCIPGTEETLTISVEERNGRQIIPQNKYTKWFDYDIIKGTLQLRTRMPGDFFIMNDNGGRKKLKAFFRDQKIPGEERQKLLLLAEGSHVLWIIGHRISAHYKITDNTKRILKVQYDGGKSDD